RLDRSSLHQCRTCGFRPDTRHALGKAKFVGLCHDGEMSIKAQGRNLSFSAHDERHHFSPLTFHLDSRCWILEQLGVRCWLLDVGCSMFDVQLSLYPALITHPSRSCNSV